MHDTDEPSTERTQRDEVALALGVLYASLPDEDLERVLEALQNHQAGDRAEVLKRGRLPFQVLGLGPAVTRPAQEAARATAGRLGSILIIRTPDAASTAMLSDFMAALNQSTEDQRTSVAKLRSALLPESRLAVSSPLMEQVRRNVEAQAELADEFGMLTAAEVHIISGSHAQNTSARASRLRSDGRIFSVDIDGTTLFPGFQFDGRGKPRGVVARVIEAFGAKLSGWELALWFTSANTWLGDARPVAQLESSPDAVVDAASRLADEILAA